MTKLRAALYGPVMIVLLLGALGGVTAGLYLGRRNDDALREQLRITGERAVAKLRERMQVYAYGLRGARGAVITAGDQLSRARFRAYSESRDLAHEFPGALGYGFIRRVAPQDESRFLEDARLDGKPDFAIRTLAPHGGDRFVIQYIEPAQDNLPTIGLDVASEANRRAAALRAMSTGDSILTAPVQLVQLGAEATGFLMFLAVHGATAPGSRAGERAVIGWVFTAFSIGRILDDLDYRGGELTMALVDVSRPGEPTPIFASPRDATIDASMVARTIVALHGRAWRVEVRPTARFLADLHLSNPWLRGAGVMAFATLLMGLLYTAQGGVRRRRRLAAELEVRVLERTDALQAANAQLALAARQLQVAQRITHVGSWEFDPARQQVTWSEELYRIVGADPQQPALDFGAQAALYTPASWQSLTAAVQHSIASGEAYELTLELIRLDGEHRTAVARGEAIQSATGTVEKLVGTLQDVTELARVRTELLTLSERLQVATSSANVGIWDWNLRDNTLVWDATMHRLYDTHSDQPTGTYETWRSRIHPDDLEAAEAELRGAIEGTRDFHTAFRIVRRSGEVRHLRPAAAVHRDPATGKAFRAIGVNWDVTEQRVAELALRSNEALQRGILAHAGSSIVATDCAGTITLFNRAAEDLLGYQADELVGRATPALMHDAAEAGARRDELERELGGPLASPFDVFVHKARQGKPEAREWTYIRKDGSRVPVLLTISALRDDAGEIFGFLGVAIDLTLRKQHENELLDLNRQLSERSVQAESASHAKSMFLAHMSHEIRTPMNAITGVTYLLQRTQLSPDQQGLVRALHSGTRTLLGMINDILDLSKIEAQQLTLDEGVFLLPQILDDLSAMMTALAADKQLALVIQLDEAAPRELVGDSVRLAQILTNLVGNAIKFTDAGSVRLAVVVVPRDDERVWMRFEVHDTGPGIDDQLLRRLFTPFTQSHQPGARRIGGTGLGLSIVKQLAALMGGDVGVESAVGAGSQFWCRIPFARAATAGLTMAVTTEAPRTPASERGHRLSGMRLLVVDDSELNLTVLSRIMEIDGAQVETASDGLEAVTRVQAATAPYDAVLMDIQMPEMDGVEATRQIRRISGCERLPIIAVTAGALAAERQLAFEAGVNEVISKPFDPEVIVASVRKYVNRARGHSLSISLPRLGGPAASTWPGVDGIDGDDVEQRLGGDVEMFRSLLALFLGELDDLDRVLSRPPSGAAAVELAQRLHKLKGAAGNLGARHLYTVASETEQAVRAQQLPAVVDGVRRVMEEVGRVKRGAEALLATAASVTPRIEPAGEALDHAHLAALARALEDHDMRALDWFAELSPALARALGSSEHARICGLLDRLDFDAAREIVVSLERALACVVPGPHSIVSATS